MRLRDPEGLIGFASRLTGSVDAGWLLGADDWPHLAMNAAGAFLPLCCATPREAQGRCGAGFWGFLVGSYFVLYLRYFVLDFLLAACRAVVYSRYIAVSDLLQMGDEDCGVPLRVRVGTPLLAPPRCPCSRTAWAGRCLGLASGSSLIS